jgi:hypothetical protein
MDRGDIARDMEFTVGVPAAVSAPARP